MTEQPPSPTLDAMAPDPVADTVRLNALEAAGGFFRGTADGATAFRIVGFDSWHPTLRAAIDELLRAPTADLFQD